jgi:hypothetical protein
MFATTSVVSMLIFKGLFTIELVSDPLIFTTFFILPLFQNLMWEGRREGLIPLSQIYVLVTTPIFSFFFFFSTSIFMPSHEGVMEE